MMITLPNKQLTQLFPNIKFDVDLSAYHNYSKPAGKALAIANLSNTQFSKITTLSKLSELKKKFNFPIKVLGNHTNILISDCGFNGLILFDSDNSNIEDPIEIKDDIVTVNKPILLQQLILSLAEQGYDLSHLNGIPGTVFSAVVNNSGANRTKKSIASDNCVRKIYYFDLKENKQSEILIPNDFFSLRNSKIKTDNIKETRHLITKVELAPKKLDSAEIKSQLQERVELRRTVSTEGYKFHTAGSFWSNGHTIEATGKRVRELLQEVNLYKKVVNGVGYSPKFGFLYTSKESTDKDVAQLTKLSYDEVLKKFGYKLHAEVEILDCDGQISIQEY